MEECFARQLTDAQYLDASEICFFMTSMIDQLAVQRPDDELEFCRLFFQKINNMQHVLGADFSYVIHCSHNRRSLVHCCLEMFKNVRSDSDFKVSDLHKLYCLICPDLSIAVVQEAALYISQTKSNPGHYSYADLQMSFFFQIIFYEWLKVVSPLFLDQAKKPILIKSEDVSGAIEDATRDMASLNFHLPLQCVSEVIRGVVKSSRGGEVSFKNVVKALVLSPSIKFFLLSKKK